MLQLTLKRCLQFIPGLFTISVLAFALYSWAPGDGAEIYLNAISNGNFRAEVDAEEVYYETREFLGLDHPSFYFSIGTIGDLPTSTFYRDRDIQNTAELLCAQFRNPKAVKAYATNLMKLKTLIKEQNLSGEIVKNSRSLFQQVQPDGVQQNLKLLKQITAQNFSDPTLKSTVEAVFLSFNKILDTPATPFHFLPRLHWNGTENQYHLWLTGWISGNGGISYSDLQPITTKISKAIKWTLILNIISIILTYLIALPLGIIGAYYKGSKLDKILTIVLLSWYSIPGFWMATMMVVFLTTPEYGFDLFPTMGTGSIQTDMSFWQILTIRIQHLTLPVLCLTYGSLAFTARQMRQSMVNELDKTYIKLARSKGLSEWKVISKHALPNAIFPILTMFGGILPSLLAGSVVIEYIFNIPGMGKLMVDAIFARDWPVVNAILILAGFLTMLGILISDLLYYWVDPRVKMGVK